MVLEGQWHGRLTMKSNKFIELIMGDCFRLKKSLLGLGGFD
jgi:hypothetical protein